MATTPKRPTTRRAKPAPTPRSRSASTPKAAAPKSSARSAAAKKEARDGHGRFASKSSRALALGIGGTIVALGAGLGTALWRGWVKMPRGPWTDSEGHKAPDLALDAPQPGTTRAPDAFRPDPTAVPSAEELDGLRPATGPSNGWS
jgi:hypothetical protein